VRRAATIVFLALIAPAGAGCPALSDSPAPPGPRWKKGILATCFWVGEPGNEKSAWDPKWLKNFGGADSPEKRDGYLPAGFAPKQNPFYCALPFNDVAGRPNVRSVLKDQWVEVRANGKVCFCQWQDVGPWHTDDRAYVLGSARPRAEKKGKAGIDLSPAVCQHLGIKGKGKVDWRFANPDRIPKGPWLEVVTGRRGGTSNKGR